MSKVVFPIAEVTGNKIVSIDGNVSFFYEMHSPDIEQLSPIEKENFFDGISSCLDNLEGAQSLKFYRIDGKGYLNTDTLSIPYFPSIIFEEFLNPLRTFLGIDNLFSDIGIYNDYLSFSGKYWRLLSVVEFSSNEIGPNYLPEKVDYFLSIKRTLKEKSISKLEKVRNGHLSSFFKNKRDISSEGTYQQAEEFLFDLMHGNESLFEMELFFIVKDYSLESLTTKTNNLYSDLLGRGIKTFVEGQSLIQAKSGLAAIFNELIPGVKQKLKLRTHLNKTSHLRYLLPLNESKLMTDGVLFHDLLDDEIFFNPFEKDIKNRNLLVTGTSGAGKSVFVNKMVHHLIDKHPTVILDKGGSFRKLTLYHEGTVLEDGINPMQFKNPSFLTEFILSVVDQNKFGKLERGKLLKEIKSSIEAVVTFQDLLFQLELSFSGISYYFEEIIEYICDDVPFEERILYVDLDKYPKGIIAPLVIYVLEYFKNIKDKEKVLVFDECWSFLKDHSTYIDECFRTFRKTGAFPIAISQSLKDFAIMGKDLCGSLTNNSYFKVFFHKRLISMERLSLLTWTILNLFLLKKVFILNVI